MKKVSIVLFLLITAISVAFADSTPVIISFQGQLRENSIPVSGNRTMHFRILDVSSNVIWQSNASLATQVTVAVSNGIYTVGLGDTSLTNMAALTSADLDRNIKLFLRVRVGTEDLSPDILLSAVPFAYIAKQAETITQNISAGNSVALALRQSTQNVGLFNTNPTGIFQVSSNYLFVSSNGNIGVSTTNPQEILDVTGRVRLGQITAPGTTTDKLYNVGGNLFWNGVTLNTISGGSSQWTTTASASIYYTSGNVGIGNNNPTNLFQVSANAFVVSSNGYVGIGIAAPQEKLHVSGSILMNDFVVTPGVTANRIYRVSGNLYWNGSQLGSSTQTVIQGTLTIPIILTVTANGTTLINTTGVTAVFVAGGSAGNHNLGLSAGVMGQMLIVVGKAGTGTPRLQDDTANGGAVPRLGGATRNLTVNKSITLIFNGSEWIEIAYGNN
jgi:hypothetical protein